MEADTPEYRLADVRSHSLPSRKRTERACLQWILERDWRLGVLVLRVRPSLSRPLKETIAHALRRIFGIWRQTSIADPELYQVRSSRASFERSLTAGLRSVGEPPFRLFGDRTSPSEPCQVDR